MKEKVSKLEKKSTNSRKTCETKITGAQEENREITTQNKLKSGQSIDIP